MGHGRILSYCLVEVDRLARANQAFEQALVRMRGAATAPLLVEMLAEQIATNTRIGLTLHHIHQCLNHEVAPREDPGATGIAAQGIAACSMEDPAVRDIALAQEAVRMDAWQIAGYSGLAAFLRQVYQDEAADQVDKIVAMLDTVDRHIEALRPSLTNLAHDNERHGHATRSPEDRITPSDLIR